MKTNESLFEFTLRLADDALITGHRLAEWSSKAPILEEDLALSNMALDYIGRAEALLKYAAQIEGKGNSEDDLAYKRPERKFYNHLLCELPNGDFAFTMLKQLFLSAYESIFYLKLMESSDNTLAAIAAKSVKEIRYHLKHCSDWCIRLGDGSEESKLRMQNALQSMWMYTGELFENDELCDRMQDAGISDNVSELESEWQILIMGILAEAKLTIPKSTYMQTGGRKGIHTEHLGYILADMQYLQRAYPDAKW